MQQEPYKDEVEKNKCLMRGCKNKCDMYWQTVCNSCWKKHIVYQNKLDKSYDKNKESL